MINLEKARRVFFIYVIKGGLPKVWDIVRELFLSKKAGFKLLQMQTIRVSPLKRGFQEKLAGLYIPPEFYKAVQTTLRKYYQTAENPVPSD